MISGLSISYVGLDSWDGSHLSSLMGRKGQCVSAAHPVEGFARHEIHIVRSCGSCSLEWKCLIVFRKFVIPLISVVTPTGVNNS